MTSRERINHKGYAIDLHPGDRWQIKIWHPIDRNKPLSRPTATNRADALRKAKKYVNTHIERAKAGTTTARTVGDLMTYWIERQRQRSQRGQLSTGSLVSYETDYRAVMRLPLTKLAVEAITPQECATQLITQNASRAFRLAWHLAIEDELTTRVTPLKKKAIQDIQKQSEEGRALTDTELQQFIHKIKTDIPDDLKFYFWTILTLGLRRSEGIGLQTSHLERGGILHIQNQWRPRRASDHATEGQGGIHEILATGYVTDLKTPDSDRHLPLPPTLAKEWATHARKQRAQNKRFMFAIHTKKHDIDYPIGTARFDTAMRQHRPAKDLSIHSLRHTMATGIATLGAPDTLVSELLGHSKKTTTARYIHHTNKTKLHYLTQWEQHIRNL